MSHIYKIHLNNCAFYAYHGVLEAEQIMGQRFFIDADLDVAVDRDLAEDQIEGTVHYGEVFELIEQIVTKERFNLIEALGLRLARQICAKFPQVTHADITVRKPSAPIVGTLDYVEIKIGCHQGE